MGDSSAFVGTTATTARLARLKERRGISDAVRTIRTEMANAGRAHTETLALRRCQQSFPTTLVVSHVLPGEHGWTGSWFYVLAE